MFYDVCTLLTQHLCSSVALACKPLVHALAGAQKENTQTWDAKTRIDAHPQREIETQRTQELHARRIANAERRTMAYTQTKTHRHTDMQRHFQCKCYQCRGKETSKFPHTLAIVHPRCQPSLDLGRTSFECCAQYPILCCCRSTVSPWPSKDLHYSILLGILRSQLLICHHFQLQSLGN